MRSSQAIDLFEKTILSTNVDEVYSILERISPNRISSICLYDLIRYVERKYKTDNYSYPHYNCFGTGGDNKSFKTINISSISSLFASRFDNNFKIVKTGTKAVTARWGSLDFFSLLYRFSKLRQIENFGEGSYFIGLNDVGYIYSNTLLEARKLLFKRQTTLDIYKVVMPAANLTGSIGQVNGVCREEYIPFFEGISKEFQRHIIIVHSIQYQVDELLMGENIFIDCLPHQAPQKETIVIPFAKDTTKYWNFFKEAKTISTHVRRFFELLHCPMCDEISWTISYNIASILKLDHKFREMELSKLSFEVYKKFFCTT